MGAAHSWAATGRYFGPLRPVPLPRVLIVLVWIPRNSTATEQHHLSETKIVGHGRQNPRTGACGGGMNPHRSVPGPSVTLAIRDVVKAPKQHYMTVGAPRFEC